MDRDGEGSGHTEELVTLADGGRVLIRHLLPGDRQELAERYEELSPHSRRLRFFNAPEHLSDRLLDYLVDLDYDDRSALVAVAVDDEGAPGVGIARYARAADDPTSAEAAVTVVDEHQRRGIGTILVRRLAEEARAHGIDTFTASVMWENHTVLDPLREVGAEVLPSEPGIASVRIPLPERPREADLSDLRQALRAFAERVGQAIGLRFDR